MGQLINTRGRRLDTLATLELVALGTRFMLIPQSKATVPVAEVVAFAVPGVREEALLSALVLAAERLQVELLVIWIGALEHVQTLLCVVAHLGAEREVALVLLPRDELVLLALAVDWLALGQHEQGALAVLRATVVVEVPGTLVGQDVGSWSGSSGTEVELGAVSGVREVALGGAAKGWSLATLVRVGGLASSLVAERSTGWALGGVDGLRASVAQLGRGKARCYLLM